jgi:hypothetical protein
MTVEEEDEDPVLRDIQYTLRRLTEELIEHTYFLKLRFEAIRQEQENFERYRQEMKTRTLN